MRRKDRATDQSFAEKIIDKCSFAVLSAITPEGGPYAVPLSVVRMDGALYFHCAKTGTKIDAMRTDSRVMLVCVGDVDPIDGEFAITYESAVVKGKAEEVTGDDEKIRALKTLSVRYTPEIMASFDREIEKCFKEVAVWKIIPEEITGKRRKAEK